MNKIKRLFSNVSLYIDKKENEKITNDTVILLMQLNCSLNIIQAVEVKQKFDFEFNEFLASKKEEAENNLNAIKKYE